MTDYIDWRLKLVFNSEIVEYGVEKYVEYGLVLKDVKHRLFSTSM